MAQSIEANARADQAGSAEATRSGLPLLALLAFVVGASTGFLGAVFRLVLDQAERLRTLLIARGHGWPVAGLLLIVAACAFATMIAAWLVRRFAPYAAGSGIPHVEAVFAAELPPAPYGLVPIKLSGGLLAIGSGLALGREGPCVQMGASIGVFVARMFRRGWQDCRALLAAGAGAGLAAAFNAPISASVFVLEEVVKRFEARIAIATLAAASAGIAVARLLLGDAPDFHLGALAYGNAAARPFFFLLGAVSGLLAVAYNRALLATLAAADRIALPVPLRAALIGAGVGVLAWFAPALVGGGDAITQRTLLGSEALALLPLAFLIRFGLSTVSYAAATPGGLFAPLLVLGAQSGMMVGVLCRLSFPSLGLEPEAFAVVGMAAFFVGVVRAPLTGVVLVTEMTGSARLLLPMLSAAVMAMLVPTLLRDAPIYDALRERLLQRPATSSGSPRHNS